MPYQYHLVKSNIILVSIILFALNSLAQNNIETNADSLFAVGEFSRAIKSLETISPKTDAVYLKLAKYQYASGETSAAIENYEKVLDKNPDRILIALDYGKALIKDRKFKKAENLFTKLISQHPENANFHYQLGLVKESLEDSTSIDLYKTTIQLQSSHQDALYRLAKNELKNRQYNMAVNYSLMGLEYNPNNASLLSLLAQGYFRQQKFRESIPPFKRIAELGQGNEFVHSKLGFAYYQEEDLNNAVEQYNFALKYEDKNSDTHYNLGKLYALTNELKKSETHLLIAILIKDQMVDAEYLSLALTYKFLEDYKLAFENFNKALEENPANERAAYERAVAADNYFKDLKTKIGYYRAYLNLYENNGNSDMIYLAKTRMSELMKQEHLTAN